MMSGARYTQPRCPSFASSADNSLCSRQVDEEEATAGPRQECGQHKSDNSDHLAGKREIAQALFITTPTVRQTLDAVRGRLGVSSAQQLRAAVATR